MVVGSGQWVGGWLGSDGVGVSGWLGSGGVGWSGVGGCDVGVGMIGEGGT